MTGAYLYQTVHTLDGRPLRLREHITVLDTASRALFERPFTPDPVLLTRQIATLIAAEQFHTDRSVFVRLLLTPTGELHLEPAGISLYRSYALRSLCPDAISLCYDLPFGEYPTSAREALTKLAISQAERQGARCVVRCTSSGVAISCDDAPLYALKGRSVYTSPAPLSVERSLAAECIAAAGLTLTEEPVMQDRLPCFDELFCFDHRGVMALARCDGHPYMSLMAERIAQAAERMGK